MISICAVQFHRSIIHFGGNNNNHQLQHDSRIARQSFLRLLSIAVSAVAPVQLLADALEVPLVFRSKSHFPAIRHTSFSTNPLKIRQ